MTPRPRLPRVPERVEQAHIVQLLRSLGASVYVLGVRRRKGDYPGTMMTAGLPDIYAFMPRPLLGTGRACAVWIEVKAVGGKLRPEQWNFRAQCAAASVPHVVGGLDAVIAWLIAGGWLRPDAVPHYRVPAETKAERGARA